MSEDRGPARLVVAGIGQVEAEPDRVAISLGVEARSPDYGACLRLLNERVERLRHDLEQAGIPRSEVFTRSFHVSTGRISAAGEKPVQGYLASHTVRAEMSNDTALLNRALARIAQGRSGATVDIEFFVADPRELFLKALASAVADARARAAAIAEAAGARLGRLLVARSGTDRVNVNIWQTRWICEASAGIEERAVDVRPEKLMVTERVEMEYELEPGPS